MISPSKLTSNLSSPDRIVRIAAAELVSELGLAAQDAIPALEPWLTSDEPYFRIVGAATILKLDPSQTDRLLPVLIEGLTTEPCAVRSTAAETLGNLGPAALPAVRHLQACLSDEAESVRCDASVAVGKITGDSQPAIQIGVELLSHADWAMRCLGAEHLGLLGQVASPAIPDLEAARDDIEIVRVEVEQALGRITGRQVVPRGRD